MRHLIIINDPPYGTERAYNALRVALWLVKRDGNHVRLFLMGDGAACAKHGQKLPPGFYNLEIMLRGILKRGAAVGVCGVCIDARGIRDEELVDGTHRSTMDELAAWIEEAEKVMVF